MKKVLIILSFLLVQSCAWFETEMKTIDLIGNIKIITAHDDMSRGITIATFFDKNNSFKTLFVNCKSILLDKNNGKIVIKSVSYIDEFEYNIIIFKSLTNPNSFEINHSSKKNFLKYLKECDNCELYDFSKKNYN